MAGSRAYGDEPSGYAATELVCLFVWSVHSEMPNAHKIIVGKTNGKRSFGRTR